MEHKILCRLGKKLDTPVYVTVSVNGCILDFVMINGQVCRSRYGFQCSCLRAKIFQLQGRHLFELLNGDYFLNNWSKWMPFTPHNALNGMRSLCEIFIHYMLNCCRPSSAVAYVPRETMMKQMTTGFTISVHACIRRFGYY